MQSHDGLVQMANMIAKELVNCICNSAEYQGSSIPNTGADRHE